MTVEHHTHLAIGEYELSTAGARAEGDVATWDATNDRMRMQAIAAALPSHDNAKHDNRTRTLWLPARSWNPVGGSAFAAVGTAPDIIDAIQFADAATQGAYTVFSMPVDFDGATNLTCSIYGAPATSTAGNVRLVGTWSGLGDSDLLTVSGSNLVNSWASPGTANELQISTGVALGGFPDAGYLLRMHIERQGANVADTMAAVFNFVGIRINYTADS